MPRAPSVTRRVKVHSYTVRYLKPDEEALNIYTGRFSLPKEYKTNFSITLNLEKLYGIHVISLEGHHVSMMKLSLPLEDYLKNAEVVNIEPITDEWFSDKYTSQKG